MPTTADVWNALNGRDNPQRASIIDSVSNHFHFFHWRLEFPEVFGRGGFDVMLGNPPWEVSQLSEVEYFSTAAPEIAALKGAARKEAIAALRLQDPILWQQYRHDLRAIEAHNEFAREGQRYPLTASGKLNSYALFSELGIRLLASHGRAGMIVQTGIVTDDSNKRFFDNIIQQNKLVSILSFENEEFIFRSIHHSFRFCLLTLRGSGTDQSQAEFVFFARQPAAVHDTRRRFALSARDIARINPNTKTAPIFRSHADAELTKKIYERVPVLLSEVDETTDDPWGITSTIIQNFFSTSNDADQRLFVYDEDMMMVTADRFFPVTRGTMIDHFDYRAASYDRASQRFIEVSDLDHNEHGLRIDSDKYIPRDEVRLRLLGKNWRHDWLLGWRDITSAHVLCTMIASFIPISATDDTLSLVLPTNVSTEMASVLLGALNSLVLDYIARQKVGGNHLRRYVLVQLPILLPTSYSADAVSFIVPKVLELSFTSEDLAPLARELGYDGPPFRWDPDRRALLKAELDAYFAYLYGLSRDELRYILDPRDVMGADYPSETFRVLKENECRAFGEYRTRRLVLDAWDRFAEDGTFDPARLHDPSHFDVVRRALVETRGQVTSLERERDELAALLKRSDATPLPSLFVEGESDVTILTAAWHAFHPEETLPVTILAAGGTRQMASLAGKGAALRQVLGDRLVFALADNDREGRDLVEADRTRRGGVWRQQTNGIYWCLLAPTTSSPGR